jgi:hypothetical protein
MDRNIKATPSQTLRVSEITIQTREIKRLTVATTLQNPYSRMISPKEKGNESIKLMLKIFLFTIVE